MKKLAIARLLAVAVVAAAAAAVAAGASGSTSAARPKVALVTINQQALFFNQLNDGAKAQAKKSKVDLTIFNANNDPNAQNSAIEDFVTQGFNAIIVDAIDVHGILPAIRAAKKKGVKIVAVDAVVKDPAVSTQVGVDNEDAGRQMGVFFDKWAKKNIPGGKAKIGVVGALNSFIQNIRLRGFRNVVVKAGHKIVQVVDGRNIQENALSAAENLVTAQPDMNAIYDTGEPANVGAIAALKSQNATKRVKLFGWDLTKEAIGAIDQGFEVGIVQQDPFGEGVASVKAAATLAAGGTVSKAINVPITIVTKANVGKYRKIYK